MTKRAGLTHIRDLLKHNPRLRRHLEWSDRERVLLDQVLTGLPAALRPHCCDVTLIHHSLTLFFDSSAWAMRARFLADDLVRTLQHEGVAKVIVRVRVATRAGREDPSRGGPGQVPRRECRAHRLSSRAVTLLQDAAAGMTDVALAHALRHLAESGGGGDQPS
ncbi:hypothetical protein CKO25_01630 [Thiocapsa imhoffii]|uniref:DUF721 domain-containing protein n=1 Tax=Thiocapsa imhoffii TaxID=382777 RepID=A0A9X0WF59_9GAMM|nr:DciA family protein [Thiocapsa imhoffii]MBK1643375.1 hypothetical protein [Thiocapsa imhoffii]